MLEKATIDAEKPGVLDAYLKTISRFLPKHFQWMEKVKDRRNPYFITYSTSYMVWMGILLFLLKMGSRRQIKYRLNTPVFIQNMNDWVKADVEQVAHPDTLAYFCSGLNPKELEMLLKMDVYSIIRSRALENQRIFGEYYLVAVDGTETLDFKERHCPHCLTRKHDDGSVTYYHKVVEAKLVTESGLCLPMALEFVENSKEDVPVQDCELLACYRLLSKLKRFFPQLRICLLMDSLYVNQNIFKTAEENAWKFIVNYKEGAAPSIANEALAIWTLENKSPNTKMHWHDDVEQKYRWAENIDYYGHMINYIECTETTEKEEKTFVWVTNFPVNSHNVQIIANQGGRQRWKIENQGFNVQKNNGYNLDHSYGGRGQAWKNMHLFMQIAHLINQLVEYGSLLKAKIRAVYGSARNLTRLLLEELRYYRHSFAPPQDEHVRYIKFQSD